MKGKLFSAVCGLCLLTLASFAFVSARAEEVVPEEHVPIEDQSIPVWATMPEQPGLFITGPLAVR